MIRDRIAYDLMDSGIRWFGGNYEYIENVYKASLSNNLYRVHPRLRFIIPTFKQIFNYLLNNGLIKEKGDNIFEVTNKGEDFLKEQKNIMYKEEQNKILRNQLTIIKNQTIFNRILALATSILAFDVIFRLIIQPNLNNESISSKIMLAILFAVFFVLIISLIKDVYDTFIKEGNQSHEYDKRGEN